MFNRNHMHPGDGSDAILPCPLPCLSLGANTMRYQFLNEPEDCQWIADTALKGLSLPPFQSFMLFGNEDCPEEVHLYADANPRQDSEYVCYKMNADGNMVKGGTTPPW